MNSAQDDEVMRVQYKDPLSAAGWTIAWHAMTLDTRMSDGALRLYLLLHRYAQQSGMAWPSLSRLAADLGVSVPTVKRRLQELTTLGLIERRKEVFGGTTTTFLLDPREQYIQIKNEPSIGSNLSPLGPNGLKNEPSIGSNLSPKEIIIEELREEEEEEEEKAEKVENCARANEIECALVEQGVFESAARQIAAAMSAAGLSAEDAIRILRATIQSILSGMPRGDEEIIGLAVRRLQRGIWDAGEQSRRALRRARYAGDSPPPPGPPPPPEATAPAASPDGAEELWEQVLAQLQLELPRATFETWLRPTRAVGRDDGVLVVQVASVYASDWLEGRLRGMVERAVERVAGEPLKVQFVVEGVPCPSP